VQVENRYFLGRQNGLGESSKETSQILSRETFVLNLD